MEEVDDDRKNKGEKDETEIIQIKRGEIMKQ
jgi:hypothetical protein